MHFNFNVIISCHHHHVPCNANIFRNTAIHIRAEHRTAKTAQCVLHVRVLPNVSSGRYCYTNTLTAIEIISSKWISIDAVFK